MAITLTIGGVNFLPQYKTGSARIRERLNSASNELSLVIIKKSGGNTPTEGKEIVFKDGSRFLFAGFVSQVDPVETGEGQLFEYRVEATDYTYVLSNKNAQKSYTSQTMKAIVENLLSTYVHSGYAFTSTNVETGPTINKIAFNHINLRKCFEKLAKVTGYEWYVDYQKNVHFFSKISKVAPETITDSTANFYEVNIKCDTSQVRNSIVVRGSKEETTSNFQQVFVGDGQAREWILREKPKSMVSIELDTGGGYSAQTYGVDPLDEEGSNYFMFNFGEKYVRLTTGQTTPTSAHKIRVTYKYEVPVIVKLKNTPSILAMQALEGGDGLHEYTIVEPSISSKAEARNRALKEIEEWGNPLVTGVVRTRTGLLSGGSIFATGQLLTVNLPTWGISTDTKYLIQEVLITLVEDGTSIEYDYTITFGGRLLGVREFIESLANKEEVILDTEEIDRIEAVDEEVTITEQITRNSNVQSVSETATISENISSSNTTPPFKWGTTATKPLKWNLGEWG